MLLSKYKTPLQKKFDHNGRADLKPVTLKTFCLYMIHRKKNLVFQENLGMFTGGEGMYSYLQ